MRPNLLKPNLLITINRGLASKSTFDTITDVCENYYKEYNPEYNVYFLTRYSSSKRVDNLMHKNKRNRFYDHVLLVDDCVKDCDYKVQNNWEEIKDVMDISHLPKFNKIIEVGAALSTKNKLARGLTNYKNLFHKREGFTFESTKHKIKSIVLLYKILKANDCEFIHYLIDPQEFDYNDIDSDLDYHRFFQYCSTSFKFERSDQFLEAHKFRSEFYDNTKSRDFVFGYTVATKERNSNDYAQIEPQLEGLYYTMLLKDKFKKIDTHVDKPVYLEYLRCSEFTLVIPAYEERSFSAFRYIEAIYAECLPIILDTNELDEVRKSLYIPDCLVANISDIRTKIEELKPIRQKLIDEIKFKMGCQYE